MTKRDLNSGPSWCFFHYISLPSKERQSLTHHKSKGQREAAIISRQMWFPEEEERLRNIRAVCTTVGHTASSQKSFGPKTGGIFYIGSCGGIPPVVRVDWGFSTHKILWSCLRSSFHPAELACSKHYRRHVKQRNRVDRPERNLCIYGLLIFDQEAKERECLVNPLLPGQF